MINYYTYDNTFILESGDKLEGIQIAYSVYGNLNTKRTIWVNHALSGNSEVLDWWTGIFGKGKLFDPAKYKIICANVIGSCYGSSGPKNLQEPLSCPSVTIKDMVKAHVLLADYLNIENIDLLIGASLGGQQALEWAITEPNRINRLILVASNAFHSPYGRAFNEAQRLALKADMTFGLKNGGQEGLKAARGIAILSYRSYEDFSIKQSDDHKKADSYRASSYIQYQGEKFKNRFDAASYYLLTQAMDSHDVSRGRQGGVEDVLQQVKTKTLVIGIDSDTLFPLEEQRFLTKHLPNSELAIIRSVHGHDAFLIDYKQLESYISDFLFNEFKTYKPTVLKRKVAV